MNTSGISTHAFIRICCALLFTIAVGLVLAPFIQSIAWAVVIAVCSWPVYKKLRSTAARGSDFVAALIATAFITLVILGVLIPLSIGVTSEAKYFATMLQSALNDTTFLDSLLSKMPGAQRFLLKIFPGDGDLAKHLKQLANENQPALFSALSTAARGATQLLFGIGVTIFTCFYLFRYGDSLSQQAIKVAYLLGGVDYRDALEIAWATVGAVLYGVVVAALLQGILAGLGFYLFGAPLPLLFGAITIVLGLIPFGPPLLYLPLSGYLLYSGAPWYSALGLALWGIGLISTADNIIRPLFISRATSLPVLFAFFGGLGGIAAFGMIGLFLGPVLLALAQVLWKRLVSKAG